MTSEWAEQRRPGGPSERGAVVPEATVVPEETIVCIDCGGQARLLTTWDEENPPRPGDLAVYRCVDCLDRWDVVVPGPDGDPDPWDET